MSSDIPRPGRDGLELTLPTKQSGQTPDRHDEFNSALSRSHTMKESRTSSSDVLPSASRLAAVALSDTSPSNRPSQGSTAVTTPDSKRTPSAGGASPLRPAGLWYRQSEDRKKEHGRVASNQYEADDDDSDTSIDAPFQPPALSHEMRTAIAARDAFENDISEGRHPDEEGGESSVLPLTHTTSKQPLLLGYDSLSDLEEEIRNLPDRAPPETLEELEQEMAYEKAMFKRLPARWQNHLKQIAREEPDGKCVRNETLCGKGMWVKKETGNIKWKTIDWNPPPKTVTVYLMQGELVIGDEAMGLRQQQNTLSRLSRNTNVSLNVSANRSDHPDSDAGLDGLLDLAPINSHSVTAELRERTRRRHSVPLQVPVLGSVAQTIRGWFNRCSKIGGSSSDHCRNSGRFSFKDLLPWRKQDPHDSGIGNENDDDRNWYMIGPKNEYLVYSTAYPQPSTSYTMTASS